MSKSKHSIVFRKLCNKSASVLQSISKDWLRHAFSGERMFLTLVKLYLKGVIGIKEESRSVEEKEEGKTAGTTNEEALEETIKHGLDLNFLFKEFLEVHVSLATCGQGAYWTTKSNNKIS